MDSIQTAPVNTLEDDLHSECPLKNQIRNRIEEVIQANTINEHYVRSASQTNESDFEAICTCLVPLCVDSLGPPAVPLCLPLIARPCFASTVTPARLARSPRDNN